MILDGLPFELAGNPGAWKAWRAHRSVTSEEKSDTSQIVEHHSKRESKNPPDSKTQSVNPRQPDEWNWDGVWQERVRNGIDASISAPVLYGSSGNSDLVGFELSRIRGITLTMY